MRRLVSVSVSLSGCVALAFCGLLSIRAALAAPKIIAPVGVVVFAEGAQVSQVTAQIGASLYAGDTLSTDANGSLRVRFGVSQLVLGPATVVKLQDAPSGIVAVLRHGVVRFNAAGSPIELRVLEAIVRPQTGASCEVIVMGPRELQVGSTKGSVVVEVDGEERVVSESTAYDVTLDSASTDPNDKRIRKSKVLWVPITIIAMLTAAFATAATLSSSKFQ